MLYMYSPYMIYHTYYQLFLLLLAKFDIDLALLVSAFTFHCLRILLTLSRERMVNAARSLILGMV